jgi:hypothetical protein
MKPGWMPLRGMKLKVKVTAGVERKWESWIRILGEGRPEE